MIKALGIAVFVGIGLLFVVVGIQRGDSNITMFGAFPIAGAVVIVLCMTVFKKRMDTEPVNDDAVKIIKKVVGRGIGGLD